MAVVLVEGFDHLSATLMTAKGWEESPSALVTGRYPATTGCANSLAAACQEPGVLENFLFKTLPTTYTTLFAGFAINWLKADLDGRRIDASFYGQYTLVTAGNAPVLAVSVNASGFLQITDSSGSVVATGTTFMNIDTWYYIEVKLVVNGASGAVQVFLDGVQEIANTVHNFGSTAVGRVRLAQTVGGNFVWFDDLYIADNTGSAPQNTFLGPVRVLTPIPTGAGTYSEWTPVGSTPNWTCVDDVPPDGDTTFVSSNTPNQRDTYLVGHVDSSATIFAVQTNIYSRKDDANTRQIATLIRQASTDYVGNTFTEAATYVDHTQIYNQDPTGTNWTAAVFNADQFGQKEIA